MRYLSPTNRDLRTAGAGRSWLSCDNSWAAFSQNLLELFTKKLKKLAQRPRGARKKKITALNLAQTMLDHAQRVRIISSEALEREARPAQHAARPAQLGARPSTS